MSAWNWDVFMTVGALALISRWILEDNLTIFFLVVALTWVIAACIRG